MLNWLVRRVRRFREAWAYAAIENNYRRAGHATPMLAACQEIHYRGSYLEAFRDFASDRYLEKREELDSIKAAYIKQELSAQRTLLDRQTTTLIRSIIQEMEPSEAFHPLALAVWEAESDAMGDILHQAARAGYGPDAISPLTRRVLNA